ncbi:MAG: 4-hydroxy-tetrahydrodipicolinate reductase [Legionellaceae bacterium]|nr:4-hydroxy-tetrahydrodipicolinate reductase [Legionellaceae bacterium]
MSVSIIVNGSNGKMGTMACNAIEEHPDFILAARLGRNDNVTDAIKDTGAAIVIDLTRADCVYKNTLAIINAGAHPIIGTSGLLDEQIKMLQSLCNEQKLGGLIVPNFSIGAILLMRFAAEAARLFSEVEIIEAHHQEKLDSPSGTAIKTADMIAAARQNEKKQLPVKEIVAGARGATYQDINIHSLRLPGILAQQQVIFGSVGETLTITHNSIDRNSFKSGLVFACQHVQKIDELYYGLEHLLF